MHLQEIMQDMEELEQYQDMEDMGIPEEYLQYLPEGFDINSLLQQYQ